MGLAIVFPPSLMYNINTITWDDTRLGRKTQQKSECWNYSIGTKDTNFLKLKTSKLSGQLCGGQFMFKFYSCLAPDQ